MKDREEYISILEQDNAELKKQLEIYEKVILANDDVPNLEKLINKPINPDLSNWYICDIQYIKGYLYALSLREQELKKQLEEKEILIKQYDLSVSNMMDCYCERTDCVGRIKDSKVYDSLVQKVETQQKEFIKYLEDMLDDENDIFSVVRVKDVLQKYKEIIGVSNERKN